MAKNDIVLLDGIIDERVRESLPSRKRDEVFEYFVLEEALKDYDLSREEIDSGWVDGRNDGGIDGFYIFVNGHLLDDSETFSWPRSNASIEVWLVTCKHHATFHENTLDKLVATVHEVFDLSLSIEQLQGSYSSELQELRGLFADAYRRLSMGRPVLNFNVVYASRGNTEEIGESVNGRARQICSTLSSLFSSCSPNFRFVGAAELVAMHRRGKTFSLEMPFLEHLATDRNSYVVLVRLEDYCRFVSDESGALRRYLFDSNIRDYLGTHGVNDDIARSLSDPSSPDFWWLNNGVTILASGATVPGKTIQLQNIQIVNGLQTTETIFRHFKSGQTTSRDSAVLVKVIVSGDPQVRDRIIRATNNQNPVELAALYATDKIQRDIDTILERDDWYYERRRNYYRNIGKPPARFVTPLYIASAFNALILKNPAIATRLRPKFMRTRQGYESVFSDSVPIEVWPTLASVYKGVDAGLAQINHPHRRGERFVTNWRALVSLIVIARRLGTFDYAPTCLVEADAREAVTFQEVEDAWHVIDSCQAVYQSQRKLKASHALFCCEEAARRFHIAGVEVVGRRGMETPRRPDSQTQALPSHFVELVDSYLPPQPWKVGVHLEVAQALNCPVKDVSAAIQLLIDEGKRHVQKDGVVYDASGKVIGVDPDRANPA